MVLFYPSADRKFRENFKTKVKLRGFRIELEAVEAALKDFARGAVVLAASPPNPAPALVAYCEPCGFSAAELRARLRDRRRWRWHQLEVRNTGSDSM